MKSKRKLFDIELAEVSLVGKPANMKNFLFFKQGKPALVVIESNGSSEGTKILVNGEPVKDLDNFSFSYYKPSETTPCSGSGISCSYSVVVDTEDGFKQTVTYWLSKGDVIMDKELVELLKAYFGGASYTFDKAKLSDKAVETIKKALAMINKYKDEFPDELKSAVGVLAEYATAYGYPEKDDDVAKAAKEAEAAKLAKATKEAQGAKDSELVKSIKELKDEITKGVDATKKTGEELETLKKRLEVVERAAPMRKGIEGQDNNNDSDKDKDQVEDKFPSIKI